MSKILKPKYKGPSEGWFPATLICAVFKHDWPIPSVTRMEASMSCWLKCRTCGKTIHFRDLFTSGR